MIVFTEYRPNYFDLPDPLEVYEFSSTSELLSSKIPQRFRSLPNFTSFAKNGNYIMAIYGDGSNISDYKWYVIGRVDNPNLVELPEWLYKTH